MQTKQSHALPSGRTLDTGRPRSAGRLDGEELSYCKEKEIPVAFDPVQQGWVPETCTDDFFLPVSNRQVLPAKMPLSADAPRYAFRKWTQADLPAYRELLDNPAVWEHLPEAYPDPLDDETAQTLIDLSNAAGHHDVFAVEREGVLVGQVRLSFLPKSRDLNEGEISYWLGQNFWRRGIASDVVALFTDRCFRERPTLREIFARVHNDNAASARVLEKSDYAYTGQTRGGVDMRIFRLNRSDRRF